MSFLTAEWRKLAMANYEVDPAVLQKYIPAGTELDFWNGTCYVSLVGFMFVNTRVLGIPIPFHRNFEEVNLRFYVRYKEKEEWKRGVVFIKEIVPKPAITFVANTLYKEHYQTMKMSHDWQHQEDHLTVWYAWMRRGEANSFMVKTGAKPRTIEAGSEAEFITEHYWGYTRASATSTFAYEVRHPRWEVYDVMSYDIQVNFRSVYGDEFAGLGEMQPQSVMLAEGSEISVESKSSLLLP